MNPKYKQPDWYKLVGEVAVPLRGSDDFKSRTGVGKFHYARPIMHTADDRYVCHVIRQDGESYESWLNRCEKLAIVIDAGLKAVRAAKLQST